MGFVYIYSPLASFCVLAFTTKSNDFLGMLRVHNMMDLNLMASIRVIQIYNTLVDIHIIAWAFVCNTSPVPIRLQLQTT